MSKPLKCPDCREAMTYLEMVKTNDMTITTSQGIAGSKGGARYRCDICLKDWIRVPVDRNPVFQEKRKFEPSEWPMDMYPLE